MYIILLFCSGCLSCMCYFVSTYLPSTLAKPWQHCCLRQHAKIFDSICKNLLKLQLHWISNISFFLMIKSCGTETFQFGSHFFIKRSHFIINSGLYLFKSEVVSPNLHIYLQLLVRLDRITVQNIMVKYTIWFSKELFVILPSLNFKSIGISYDI